MALATCGNCGTRVSPTSEGTCPSCRQPFVAETSTISTTIDGGIVNPYATSVSPASAASIPNPLFVPAMLLVIGETFWVLYLGITIFILFGPTGVFNKDPYLQTVTGVSYGAMLVTSLVSIAGAVALLTLRWKTLAWIGVVLALVPLFGPCLGFTIPLAIWCLVLLRRPNVNASFAS